MTIIDKFLQSWRIKKAITLLPMQAIVLDIGCHEGELFFKAASKIKQGVGIDPFLQSDKKSRNYVLCKSTWQNFDSGKKQFDAVTMLAVLEHILPQEQQLLASKIFNWLKPGGKLIITVPDKKVDRLLQYLTKFKLVKGMQLEEHYGFEANHTPDIFIPAGFQLQRHQKFQLGYNNIYVFVKPST